MKKIGILFGQENTFPQAFIDRINEKNIKGIMAEAVLIDKVMQADPTEYAVIIDRISQDVPFYRAYLKNAAISGTAVLNNPFWWSADEKFFNNALAVKTGVPVPKTVLLPSKDRPDDTSENSFRNLKYPMDWDGIFEHIGFPAYMKPFAGGGWKNVYKLNNADEFFQSHRETGQLIMMLQEEIVFNEYFRCYCLGGNEVRIMQYEPRNPHHLRYVHDGPPLSKKLLDTVKDYTIKLNAALGYDFNTVEFAVRDGIPYAIDFCNPAPDADINSVGQENFEWVVETAANMAIKRAQAQKPNQMNLTWGTFIKNAVTPTPTKPVTKKATAVTKAKKPSTKEAVPAVKTAVAKKAPAKAPASSAKKDTPAAKTAAKKATVTKATVKKSTAAKAKAPANKKPVKKATTTKSKSK
jgi:glutathione synthase/RimK-type ligase-like ATP-grasp enzyme